MHSPLFNSDAKTQEECLTQGLHVIETEHKALGILKEEIRNPKSPLSIAFNKAIDIIFSLNGHLAITGIGKSGIIARKIQATLASTGTPSFFIHPAEASHGDLGMLTMQDGVMAFSHSGETREIKDIIHHCTKQKLPLIAVTSNSHSSLAHEANITLPLPKVAEASPHGLAPTTSTLLQLSLGDALAITLLQQRKFSQHEFGHFHPGGRLGAYLRPVRSLMHQGNSLPLVQEDSSMRDTIMEITRKALGCVGIIDKNGKLIGVITDGDLRRALNQNLDVLTAGDVMTSHPRTIDPNKTTGNALHLMNDRNAPITALFVVQNQRPIGIIHVHDLIRAGIT